MKYVAEYINTLGGDAGYALIRRVEFDAPEGINAIAAVYYAKEKLGMLGVDGEIRAYEDEIEWRPYEMPTILYITILPE